MRKLLIGLLAVVFVLGMSSGVMAEAGSLQGSDTVEDTVDIEVTVDEYGELTVPESDFVLELTEPELPGDAQNKFQTESKDFNFTVNTDVDVNMEWTWDDVPGVSEWTGGNFDEVISPNIILENTSLNFDNGHKDAKSRSGVISATSGNYDFDLRLETRWANDWHKLEADTYNGTLTVTIASS